MTGNVVKVLFCPKTFVSFCPTQI